MVDGEDEPRTGPLGAKAGGLTEEAAGWTGLRPGTAVAVAIADAHATPRSPGHRARRHDHHHGHEQLPIWCWRPSARRRPACAASWRTASCPACTATSPARAASATSLPGSWTMPCRLSIAAAKERGVSVHTLLEEEAAKQRPGEHGLLALDWWNGNRSTLVDVELSGLLIGATLATTAPTSTARCLNRPPSARARSSGIRRQRRARRQHRRRRRSARPQQAAHADLRRDQPRVPRGAQRWPAPWKRRCTERSPQAEAGGYADIFEASSAWAG